MDTISYDDGTNMTPSIANALSPIDEGMFGAPSGAHHLSDVPVRCGTTKCPIHDTLNSGSEIGKTALSIDSFDIIFPASFVSY